MAKLIEKLLRKGKTLLPLFDEESEYYVGMGAVIEHTRYSPETVHRIQTGNREPTTNFIESVTLNLRYKYNVIDDTRKDITNEFYTSKNLFGEEYADIVL